MYDLLELINSSFKELIYTNVILMLHLVSNWDMLVVTYANSLLITSLLILFHNIKQTSTQPP